MKSRIKWGDCHWEKHSNMNERKESRNKILGEGWVISKFLGNMLVKYK